MCPYKNPEDQKAAVKRWYEKHPNYTKDYYKRNKERIKKYNKKKWKEYSTKLRLIVLLHYGGSPPKCACCGTENINVLTIDHIYGGGNQHRKKIGGRLGTKFYLWLIKNNFPKGYQVLCRNCNWIERLRKDKLVMDAKTLEDYEKEIFDEEN